MGCGTCGGEPGGGMQSGVGRFSMTRLATCECPAIDRQAIADQLEEATEHGTNYQVVLALRDYINAALLVREGEVVTPELSRERAANMAQAIGGLLRRGA